MNPTPTAQKRAPAALALNPQPNSLQSLRPLLDLPRLRQHASDQIDELIALVDWIDGDPDLEACCEDAGAQCDDEGISA